MRPHGVNICIALCITAALSSLGCSSDGNSGLDPGSIGTEPPVILSVTPSDGQSGVPTDTAVGIKFDMTMDSASVRAGFRLSGGDDMHAWMDSLGHHGGGMMGGHMDHMHAWMDTIHYHGEWHWNDVMDSCYFLPSDSLMPHTDHMVYLYGEIRSAHGTHMETDLHQYGGPMFHFRTGP